MFEIQRNAPRLKALPVFSQLSPQDLQKCRDRLIRQFLRDFRKICISFFYDRFQDRRQVYRWTEDKWLLKVDEFLKEVGFEDNSLESRVQFYYLLCNKYKSTEFQQVHKLLRKNYMVFKHMFTCPKKESVKLFFQNDLVIFLWETFYKGKGFKDYFLSELDP